MKGVIKGRTTKTYLHKIDVMKKRWNKSEKLQKKYTLDDWLAVIKNLITIEKKPEELVDGR